MSTATGGNGQAPTTPSPTGSETGQAPLTPPNNTPSHQGGQTGQAPTAYNAPTEDDWKRTQQELAEARRDAAKYRDAIKKQEDAQLSELQKAQKDNSELQERLASLEVERQNWRLADAIAKHAPAIGLIDPDAARLMLLNGGELETDDDGNYKNVEKLLEKLVAAKPYLVASTTTQPRANFPTSGGATNPGRSAAPAAQPTQAPSARDMYVRHKQRGGLGDTSLWKR